MTSLRALVARLVYREPVQKPESGPLTGMRLAVPRSYLDAEASYEPAMTAAIARLASPGAICADLGAHLGYFTLLMARLAGPTGRVTAFEASAENARVVRRNVRLNRFGDRVTVEHAAVVGQTGEDVPIFAGRSGGSMEWTTDADFATREDAEMVQQAPAMRIRGVALDDYFPPGSRLDLMKVDIEGAEAQAVPGMARVLREARPTIALEFHREVGWPAIPALTDAGYRFTTLEGEPLAPFAGAAEVPYQLVAEPS